MSELSDAELADLVQWFAHNETWPSAKYSRQEVCIEAARRLRPSGGKEDLSDVSAKADEQLARSFAKGWYPDDDEWTRCKALTEDFLAYGARVRREERERVNNEWIDVCIARFSPLVRDPEELKRELNALRALEADKP